ncbi:hypothetical protein [Knoellia koreensis]|jgi:hypothetical protein|uniref:hypothetical protein n=1 Tax=Knoellia koreensis TaxID=2730921 RepID=UPI00197E66BC|nr:hypothetical protein [Knoellia sp. DB2414S]
MPLFSPPGGATQDPRRRAQIRGQRLDMLLGILGTFSFLATIQLVVLELRGQPAVGPAILLAVLLLATWLTWRARRNNASRSTTAGSR